MTNQYCRNVPVVEYEKVVARCSPGNVVNWIITTRDHTIRNHDDTSVNYPSS